MGRADKVRANKWGGGGGGGGGVSRETRRELLREHW